MKFFFVALILGWMGRQLTAAEYWQTNGPAVSVIRETPGPSPGDRPKVTREFVHFIPGTLNHRVWTNLCALTNGRTAEIWSTRKHPLGWPKRKPRVAWNTNSLVYGLQGFTALSPCWEGEGLSGNVPVTALTRRHGYNRGHNWGGTGFRTDVAGTKIWFVTPENRVVEVKVKRAVVRFEGGFFERKDYAILLFDRDLPEGVQPLQVVGVESLRTNYPNVSGTPWTLLKTEQSGRASIDLPGFQLNTWKGGDSGSPDLLVLPGELVFTGGRSTSPPSPEMQKDMDELCRLEGLDPGKYQMQWKRFE